MPAKRRPIRIKAPFPTLEEKRKSMRLPKRVFWDICILVWQNGFTLEKERRKHRLSKSRAWDTLRDLAKSCR